MSARAFEGRFDVGVWQVPCLPDNSDPAELTTFELVRDGATWLIRPQG